MTDAAAPAVTVVIPAYRAEDTIARALTSVLCQADLACAIVVVDGDGDRTAERARAFADPRVMVVEQPVNLGAQRSRNAGLALVRTPCVLFLDADDFHEGAVLAGLVAALTANEAELAFAPMQIARGHEARRDPPFQPTWRSAIELFEAWFVERRFVVPAAVMWRTDYLVALGGWDEAISKNQDGELVMRAALAGARVATSRQGRAVYVRDVGESLSSRADTLAGLLRVSEKVLDSPSATIPLAERRRACALHDYRIAWDCFERGADALGAVALARSRDLGFRGHRGPVAHRWLAQLIGLRAKCVLFDAAKRLLGRPGKRVAAR